MPVTCRACGELAAVQWKRRPTADELAEITAVEQSRRDEFLLLADPQQPAPEFPPMPTAADTIIAVYACAAHAIGLDLAALVHASDCTAPDPAVVPRCSCTPEPPPPEDPEMLAALGPNPALPNHWQS
jgi:hypothetical protein